MLLTPSHNNKYEFDHSADEHCNTIESLHQWLKQMSS